LRTLPHLLILIVLQFTCCILLHLLPRGRRRRSCQWNHSGEVCGRRRCKGAG